MLIKRCSKCGEVKAVELFPVDRRLKAGRASSCKTCVRRRDVENKDAIVEQKRRYYLKNKDAIAEKQRHYRSENKESYSGYWRQYRSENKEVLTERDRRRYVENKDAIAEQKRRYCSENKDVTAERYRRYCSQNRERVREYKRRWEAKCRVELSSAYIKSKLRRSGGGITPEVVELKKSQLAITRAVRTAQNHLKETLK